MMKNCTLLWTLVLILLMLPFAGCDKPTTPQNDQPAESQSDQQGPAHPMLDPSLDMVRSVPLDELDLIGPKNNLPCNWVIHNAWFVQFVAPTRFAKYSGAPEILRFFKNNPNLVPFWNDFSEIEYLLMSNKFAIVPLLDPKTNTVISPQSPLPARAVYIRKTKPVDRKAMSDFAFVGINPDQLKKETINGKEVTTFEQSLQLPLDQEQKQFAKVEGIVLALHFPDEHSAVFVTAPRKDIEKYFGSDTIEERGAGAQRINRIDAAATDFAFLMNYDHPLVMAMPLYYSDPLGNELLKNAKFSLFNINANAASGGDTLKMIIDCKGSSALAQMQTALGNTLMQMSEQANQANKAPENIKVPAFMKGLDKLVKSVRTEQNKSMLIAYLKNNPEVDPFFASVFKDFNEVIEKTVQNQRYAAVSEQLFNLGRFMTNYFGKHGTYPPAAIRDKDGKPLLSWRVALLPEFGPQGLELYKQFKLDEPWNSENNIKLLEKIPSIYVSPVDRSLKTKTTFQVFSSPDSPFGSKPDGLKIQDIAIPGKTLMVVSTRPEHAVEWTKPEELLLNQDKLVDLFGDVIVAIPFMGDVVRASLKNNSDDIKKLASLITGKPESKADAPKAEPKKAAPPKADAPKAEPKKADPPKADAPKVEPKKADPPKADAPKVEPKKGE